MKVKTYYYIPCEEFFRDPRSGLRNKIYKLIEVEGPYDEDREGKARAFATLLGVKLCGGYTDVIPKDGYYYVIKCPDHIKPEKREYDIIDAIIDYESGNTSPENYVKAVSMIKNSKFCQHLQGQYQRIFGKEE